MSHLRLLIAIAASLVELELFGSNNQAFNPA